MMTRPGTGVYNYPAPPAPPVTTNTAYWDATIGNVTDLSLIQTVDLLVPAIRAWVNEDTSVTEVWHLLQSTAATIEGAIQRPADFNAITNQKVWFKASS